MQNKPFGLWYVFKDAEILDDDQGQITAGALVLARHDTGDRFTKPYHGTFRLYHEGTSERYEDFKIEIICTDEINCTEMINMYAMMYPNSGFESLSEAMLSQKRQELVGVNKELVSFL